MSKKLKPNQAYNLKTRSPEEIGRIYQIVEYVHDTKAGTRSTYIVYGIGKRTQDTITRVVSRREAQQWSKRRHEKIFAVKVNKTSK